MLVLWWPQWKRCQKGEYQKRGGALLHLALSSFLYRNSIHFSAALLACNIPSAKSSIFSLETWWWDRDYVCCICSLFCAGSHCRCAEGCGVIQSALVKLWMWSYTLDREVHQVLHVGIINKLQHMMENNWRKALGDGYVSHAEYVSTVPCHDENCGGMCKQKCHL